MRGWQGRKTERLEDRGGRKQIEGNGDDGGIGRERRWIS